MNRDPLLAPVAGVYAAQQIRPQARTLAQDRGIRWPRSWPALHMTDMTGASTILNSHLCGIKALSVAHGRHARTLHVSYRPTG
jgi:hypothetical protein